MVITIDANLEAALRELAQRRGMDTEAMAVDALRARVIAEYDFTPRDDWERRLREAASDCGVALPPEALTSEGVYE